MSDFEVGRGRFRPGGPAPQDEEIKAQMVLAAAAVGAFVAAAMAWSAGLL